MAVATIVAKNYVSSARVLAHSLRRAHPELPFFVLLADEVESYFDPREELYRFLPLSAVSFPDWPRSCFRYERQQLSVMLKPYVLGFLLERGFRSAVFFDPDVLVLNRLDSLFTQVKQHSVTLTPHLLEPITGDDRAARELNILQSGTLNGGFLGVSDTATAGAFLAWWRERMHAHCRHDLAQGVYYDQRWLDLVPVLFGDVHLVRDPAFNVAYWNLSQREVCVRSDDVLVDGKPCGFFHFSGFEADKPQAVTRYHPRLNLDSVGSAAELFRRYAALLEAAGYHTTKHWPYAFERADGCEGHGTQTDSPALV